MQRGDRIRALWWLSKTIYKQNEALETGSDAARFKIFSSEHELDLAGTGLVIEVGDGVAQTVWEPSLHQVKPERFILGRRVFLPVDLSRPNTNK